MTHTRPFLSSSAAISLDQSLITSCPEVPLRLLTCLFAPSLYLLDPYFGLASLPCNVTPMSHSFQLPFHYLLSIYCVPITTLCTGDLALNKTGEEDPCLPGIYILVFKTVSGDLLLSRLESRLPRPGQGLPYLSPPPPNHPSLSSRVL